MIGWIEVRIDYGCAIIRSEQNERELYSARNNISNGVGKESSVRW